MSILLRNMDDRHIQRAIGAWIRTQRLKQNMSQQELADRSALSRRTITNIEGGRGCCLISLIGLLRVLNSLEHLALITRHPLSVPHEPGKRIVSHQTIEENTTKKHDSIWAWET